MNTMNDPYNIWNGEKFEFTLNKICKIIYKGTFKIPDKFKAIADISVKRIMADNISEKSGIRVVFDLSWNKEKLESKKKIQKYLEDGIIVVTDRIYKDNYGKEIPVIKVQDPWKAWIDIGRYVKNVFPIPTIGITGSAGKTTATVLAQCVFNERYNTFISGEDGKNFNTTLQIVNQWILRGNPEYTFHIQECGGETPTLIESSAQVINADAFGITNIDTSQHIATYGSQENLISDKTSFDRVRKENTFAVINLDDNILKNFKFKSPVVTFAIDDKTADYVGCNIKQTGEFLEFDVLNNDRCVHIKINIVGKHNVYNALMVFAFAKKFNLSDEEIQRGFLKYKSIGIRQNLRKVAGRYIYMDSYNASVESTLLTVKTLAELEITGKKIAVVGERKTANEETYQINYNLGKELCKFNTIDEIIVIGEKNSDKQALYDGIINNISDKSKISYYEDLGEVSDRLKYQTVPGDAILFKGRHQLYLWCISDIAFGTSYTKSKALSPLGLKKKLISTSNYMGEYSGFFAGVNLLWAQQGFDNTKIILPNAIKDKFIVRIDDEAFANKSQLKLIILGTRVRAIGDKAFYKCTNLDYMELPKKCCYIGYSSFEGCNNLTRVTMLGVGHISENAFKDCKNLKQVMLSEKCATIEKNAFFNCNDLTILAPENSYAANYARKNGFSLNVINSEDEMEKRAKNGTRLNPNLYGIKKFEQKALNNKKNAQNVGNIIDISVVVAGDIMIHDTQLRSSLDINTGLYNFDKLFMHTKKYIEAADIAIGNLETTFGQGEYSGFPRFNTPDSMADSLLNAGFNVIAIANNHIFDTKYAGVVRTKNILENKELNPIGVKTGRYDKGYVVIETKGLKVAILNYTYRSPSIDGKKTLNSRVMDDNSVNSINTFCYETLDDDLVNISKEVKNAKENSDIVLMYYHWGCEYERHSNVLQKYIAYKTALMGVDAIIGSHSHVLQEIDEITVGINGKSKKVPVFYGLGNYCWGARLPRTERETVNHGALAELNIVYDKANKAVIRIDTDYIPIYIKADYIYDKFDFNILSIDDMDDEEISAFNLLNSNSIEDIRAEIKRTLNNEIHNVKYELAFEKVIEISIDETFDLTEDILSGIEFVNLKSENATVASVLQNGKVIGHSKGFTGITVIKTNGTEMYFVINVTGLKSGVIPVIVDENNSVTDIYRPYKMQTGAEYALKGAYLEKSTAEAWRTMQLAAKSDGINLKCISGWRSNEGQLKKIVEYSENNGLEAAYNRFMPLGCSEHQLGNVLDVTSIKDSEKIASFNWIKENASQFGFIIRDISNKEVDMDHLHIRYLGNIDASKYLNDNAIDFKDYVENYDDYINKIKFENSWKSNYLDEANVNSDRSQWNELTLRRICNIIDIQVPVTYKDIENRIIPYITLTDKKLLPGSLFFYDKNLAKELNRCRNALRKGAFLAITENMVKDEIGKFVPQIVVDDSFNACVKICNFIRMKFNTKVICIEEKNREHILRDMVYDFLSIGFNVHKNLDKIDNRINIVNTIQQMKKNHNYYIQNMYGAYDNYIEKNAEMLSPNYSLLLSIDNKYPKYYSSEEKYLEDKFSLIHKTLDNGGIVIINIDDERLKNYNIDDNNIVTFSIYDKNADYYMKRIKKKKNILNLTIVAKGKKEIIQIKKEEKDKIHYHLAMYALNAVINEKEV